jgi:hypothetical protein
MNWLRFLVVPCAGRQANKLTPAALWTGLSPASRLKPLCFQFRSWRAFRSLMIFLSNRAAMKRWRNSSARGFEGLHGELMKSTLAVVETGGRQDVEMGMEDAVAEKFYRCGDLSAGFTRLQCPDCGHEKLLCKGRHFCPSRCASPSSVIRVPKHCTEKPWLNVTLPPSFSIAAMASFCAGVALSRLKRSSAASPWVRAVPEISPIATNFFIRFLG